MNKTRQWIAGGAILFVILVASYWFLFPQTSHLVILHTGGSKGQVLPKETDDGQPIGGIAFLAGAIKTVRRNVELAGQDPPILLVDTGDNFFGSPEAFYTQGLVNVQLMSEIGYDAMALGNLDFLFGQGNLEALASASDFGFLAANLVQSDTGEPPPFVQPYVVLAAAGSRIGIIGLTDPEIATKSYAEIVEGLNVLPEATALQRALEALSEDSVSLVLVLSHLEPAANQTLLTQFPQIDLLIGKEDDEDYSSLQRDLIAENVRLVGLYSQAKTRLLGRLDVTIDNRSGKIRAAQWQRIPVLHSQVMPDARILRKVTDAESHVDRLLNTVIGEAAVDIVHVYDAESALGNFITDIMREATNADIAFHNSGAIREDIAAGPITNRLNYTVNPFDNDVVGLYLTGAQVETILEQSLTLEKGMLQVSGLRLTFDSRLPAGQRLRDVTVTGRPLLPDQTYYVATNDFVAYGGDHFVTFCESEITQYYGSLRNIVADYVRDYSPVRATVEGRITDLATP